MYTDTIADYLTRVRNASMAGHKVVDIPSSNIKKDITKILFDQGFILSYKSVSKQPVIKEIQRISKPGLRKYSNSTEFPRILNGLGISIISTSKGVMTGKQAASQNIGGELICYVF